MAADIAISLPDDGELSDTDRETVEMLVDRLCAAVGVDETGLPPLTVERTETSVVLRPDAPMYVDELGTRFEVVAVARNDNGTRTTAKIEATERDQETAKGPKGA